jgi:hypothetical protein
MHIALNVHNHMPKSVLGVKGFFSHFVKKKLKEYSFKFTYLFI